VIGSLNAKDSTKVNSASMNVLVKMVVADSVYQSTFIDRKGYFRFDKLCTDSEYKIEFYYLGYKMQPVDMIKKRTEDLELFRCRFDVLQFQDSIFRQKDFKFPILETYFTCGLMMYSDFKLRSYSRKYGFEYMNLGCYGFDEHERNKEVIQRLNKSLGDNWEKVFEKEIDSKLKY